MARALIQAGLLVLLALALFHISKAEMETDEEQQLEEKSQGNAESDIEELKWRIAREAGGKSKKRPKQRKKNNEKRKARKAGKSKNKSRESKNKSGKIRKHKKNSSERKKKSRKSKKKSSKIKARSGRNGKGKNKSKKNQTQNKKKERKTKTKKSKSKRKRKGYKISRGKPRQTCDVIALCQKIKDYIKISNQLRKVNRIIKSCDTMEKKANKSATEFDATVAALETAIGSRRRLYISKWRRSKRSVDDVTTIKDKLKSCSKTAKALCERSSVPACLETDLLTRCKTELGDWVKKFGPAKGSCLKESDDCCACITALPAVSVDCLDFIAKSESAVKSKNNCTSNSKEGSFGDCRKQQHLAAEKGPAVACGSTAGTVTSGPTAAPTTAAPTTAAPTTAAPTAAATTTAAAATTAAPGSGSCAVKCGVKKQGTKIVGGTEATVNEYPWMALLSMGCGGSVIADKWILTAAHCFYGSTGSLSYTDSNIGDVTITIGDHDRFSNTESTITKAFPAEKLIVHPNYKHENHENDIALLRVADANKMDLKVYTPVCLPAQGTDYSGKKAWVYGWGTLTSGGSQPDKLQELEITVVTDASAKASYAANGQGTTLNDAQLAVMVFGGGELNKDGCQGDSGGPFTYSNPTNNNQHELVGAVSWGLGCGVAGLPGAYTEVSAFRTWVDGQIAANGGAVFTC